MTAAAAEIARVQTSVDLAHPGHPELRYALPWYLVIGAAGSGRSSAIQAMSHAASSESPAATSVPPALASYWVSAEAVFIEPRVAGLAAKRESAQLKDLCEALRASRPREPVAGIVVVVNIAGLLDRDAESVGAQAADLRRRIAEVTRSFDADLPVYLVLTRYDAVWGFAGAFAETPAPDPGALWGFTMPPDLAADHRNARLIDALDALEAQVDARCLSVLVSEAPIAQRALAFQHRAEMRALMGKAGALLHALSSITNSYDGSPRICAVVLGSAVPDGAARIRVGGARTLGMSTAAVAGWDGKGRMPFAAFARAAIAPNREPPWRRARLRDDKVTVICLVLGLLLLGSAVIAVFVLARGR